MMDADAGASQRQYRRGAIMGLTVAEAFMLIAFALLLLFLLWRFEYERDVSFAERLQKLNEQERRFINRIIETREFQEIYAISNAIGSSGTEDAVADLVEVAEMLGKMPADQRARLEEIVAGKAMPNIAQMDEFLPLDSPGFAAQFDEMKNRWRLMDEEAIRRITEAVAEFPEDARREFGNLVTADGVEETIARFAALQELLDSGHTVEDIMAALAVAEEMAKAGHSDIAALKARIQASLTEERERQDRLTADLRASLGSQVAQLGGQIKDDGTIVVPNSVSFERGSHTMTTNFTMFLERMCEPWITTMASSGQEISEVRFEGHASAEWEGAQSEQDAFLRNLQLSQERAQTVLATCLGLIEDERMRDWTEQRATAIGYSSARPVLRPDDTVSREVSRRVEFSASFDRAQVLEEIGTALSQ